MRTFREFLESIWRSSNTSFWVKGSQIIGCGKYAIHADAVVENPEKFGIPPEKIADLFAQAEEEGDVEVDSTQIYQLMFDRGWLRVGIQPGIHSVYVVAGSNTKRYREQAYDILLSMKDDYPSYIAQVRLGPREFIAPVEELATTGELFESRRKK